MGRMYTKKIKLNRKPRTIFFAAHEKCRTVTLLIKGLICCYLGKLRSVEKSIITDPLIRLANRW